MTIVDNPIGSLKPGMMFVHHRSKIIYMVIGTKRVHDSIVMFTLLSSRAIISQSFDTRSMFVDSLTLDDYGLKLLASFEGE